MIPAFRRLRRRRSPLVQLAADRGDSTVICTVATRRRLAWADRLGASLRVHAPGRPFVVVVTDDGRGLPDIAADAVLSIDDVLGADAPAWAFAHDERELGFALGPVALRHMVRQGFSTSVFIKEESIVVGSLDGLLQRAAEATVTLVPHFLEWPEGASAAVRARGVRLAGTYNGGVLAVGRGVESLRFLDWWISRVEPGCTFDPLAGEHYEQRWLDLAPTIFEGVVIDRDPGVDVGHWNLPERPIRIGGGATTASGSPAAVVRFSGYTGGDAVTSYYPDCLTLGDVGDARVLFDEVAAMLAGDEWQAAGSVAYAYGRFRNGVAIPSLARRMFAACEGRERFGDPFACGRRSFAAWLDEAVDNAQRPISRFWLAVWEERPDLRVAFPDPTGADADSFAYWIAEHGCAECGAPLAFRKPRS